MTFDKHPSDELVRLFNKKPYQGQDPSKAKIVFLGSDANYTRDITNHTFFSRILEYHRDGVQFWRTHGKHHPFLLSEYPFDKRKDGVPFHRNFSKLGLLPVHAPDISFVELLDVPTIGMKSESEDKKFFALVSEAHIDYLDKLILSERKKLILIPGGVLRDMRKIRRRFAAFSWLNDSGSAGRYDNFVAWSEIKQMPHFSSSDIHEYLPTLRTHISRWLS